jgi:hypothetical protein
MVQGQLCAEEQHLVEAVCAELDGMPYVEKARIIRTSLEAFRRGECLLTWLGDTSGPR